MKGSGVPIGWSPRLVTAFRNGAGTSPNFWSERQHYRVTQVARRERKLHGIGLASSEDNHHHRDNNDHEDDPYPLYS